MGGDVFSPCMFPHLLWENSTTATNCWTIINQRMLNPTKKDIPVQGQRRSPKTVWGAKFCLESNPIPARDDGKAQTKPCAHQDPRTPQETESQLPLSVWVSPEEAQIRSGLPQGQGLWLQQAWEAQHMSPTIEPPSRQPTNWRTIILKTFSHCHESSRTHNRFSNLRIWQRDWEIPGNLTLKASGVWLQSFHRTGETDSWRAQTKPCAHQDPGERSSVPKRDWARLVCVQESPAEGWVDSGLLRG